ncbi:MAG TPA: hypothetical protein PLH64_04540 [Anaerolineaceae bacterium]|nr:hypothetical protein [Anaerolineaceae bacterium]
MNMRIAVSFDGKTFAMQPQSLTPQDATGLLSLIGLIALFVGLLILTHRTQLRRQQQAHFNPSPAMKPFPQASNYSQQLPISTQLPPAERQATLHQAFEDWQAAYLLRGLDGQTEFLRGETYKRGLRYQLTSTSLAQGLGLFIQAQMAQNGDDSRGRFERMLAYLLAHPAQDQPALSSWLSMPDLPTSPRLESDLHAEAWILAALLAARQQWGGLQRFDLDQIFQQRSQALLEALNTNSENGTEIFSPLLFNIISQQVPDPFWQTQTEVEWNKLIPHLRENNGLPGRQEALNLLQIGLDGLLFPDNGFAETSDLAFARLKRALSERKALEGDMEEGFSRLASVSCCVPLALLEEKGEDPDQLWSLLNHAQPGKQDSLGASLRLIAMMSMTGTLWVGRNGKEPSLTTSE